MKTIFFLMLAFFCNIQVYAQESIDESKPSEKFRGKHSFSLVIGHAHILNGLDVEGNRRTQVLPFWGVDYNFQFARKFAVGLHTDVIVETFEVEKDLDANDHSIIERTRPVAPALMIYYKPTKHWSFGLGMGGEFAKEENFALTRAAIEYGAEIRKGWEVFGGLQYDFRWKAYDTWTIGMGISKAIGRKE